ncbi:MULTISPECIES: YjjG family noncanonical pyrimidine nucleotidase [Sphingobacterium]|uniref:YjjG family noncanonical pyrimidine nucleotidase n=1 Tax=Sphingobacterium populi TaxID=1812824 RepID=A0ABW5UG42_9SPHI|nr:YjjG family noncanonical pyrimidine nucleotidase [Sphingobacterium sp. CFCC 11742]
MFTHKKDIFFDLDHTIWDFDRNATETLQELYVKYGFDELCGHAAPDSFITAYTSNNHRLWGLYHHNKIDKPTLRRLRFEDTFTELGIDPNLFPWDFEEEYLAVCPNKTHLFPHAHETLSYLKDRYTLHLISNGFQEACERKLAGNQLADYFDTITISELVGINKPDARIFQHALHEAKAAKQESIMIGDNLDADVRGAQNFGMDAIFFNPLSAAVPDDIEHSIADLKELQRLF